VVGTHTNYVTYLLAYLFTPWRRVLLEKLRVFQLVKKFPAFLWNQKVTSQVPATCPILRQIDPVHALTSHFLKVHLNIIIPSTPGSSLFGPHHKPVYTSAPPMRATFPAISFFFDFITRTIVGEGYRSLSSSLRSFLHSPVTSSLLGPNILHNILFSNTLSLRSSLNVSDQVSHPYHLR